MLETLKFVKAAVGKPGGHPATMHFRISGGTVQATNGKLAMQAPLPTDLDCTPHAEQFLKAVSACEDVITMYLEAGKLVVRSGKFKSHVDCCDNSAFPRVTPSGQMMPVNQPIFPVLRKLLPFVSTDDRHPWAGGVHFANNSAIATNSIAIVEHWLPFSFPVIANIPREAVVELVRLKMEPVAIQADTNAVTFHLPEGAWISCGLLNFKWPDIQSIFEKAASYDGAYLRGGELSVLLDNISKLENFTDDRRAVYFNGKTVSTVPDGHPGTSIDCPHAPTTGVYRADILSSLRGVVDCVGFGNYPDTIPFFGGDGHLRGVMVGYTS